MGLRLHVVSGMSSPANTPRKPEELATTHSKSRLDSLRKVTKYTSGVQPVPSLVRNVTVSTFIAQWAGSLGPIFATSDAN